MDLIKDMAVILSKSAVKERNVECLVIRLHVRVVVVMMMMRAQLQAVAGGQVSESMNGCTCGCTCGWWDLSQHPRAFPRSPNWLEEWM